MDRDLRTLISYLFWGIVAIAFAGTVATGLYWITNATMRNLETEAIRNSNQYVQTKQDLLFKLMDDYTQLESEVIILQAQGGQDELISAKRGQMIATLTRMHDEAGLIDADKIPAEVARFLLSHPRPGR